MSMVTEPRNLSIHFALTDDDYDALLACLDEQDIITCSTCETYTSMDHWIVTDLDGHSGDVMCRVCAERDGIKEYVF